MIGRREKIWVHDLSAGHHARLGNFTE